VVQPCPRLTTGQPSPCRQHLRQPPFRAGVNRPAAQRLSSSRPVVAASAFSAALIFDCDGVIVETEELHRLAYNKSFDYYGLTVNGQPVEWSVEYYDILQNTVGGGKPKMRYFFTETAKAWPKDARGFTPSTEDEQTVLIDRLQDKKTEFYKVIVEEVATARPGVLDLMDQALDNPFLAVAICSAATKAGFEKVVNAIVGPERLQRFDLVLAGDDVDKKKPHPLIYNLAAQHLGVHPDDCLVVEDSLVGLNAALGANMKCLITYHKSTENQPFMETGAAAVVPALAGDGYQVTLDSLFAPDTQGALKPKICINSPVAQVAAA